MSKRASPIFFLQDCRAQLPGAKEQAYSSSCRIAVPSFLEQHGMRACMVAPTKIIAGLGISLGIHRLHAPGTTGEPYSSCRV